MNKLQEQIRKAIISEKSVGHPFDEEDTEAASELCTTIAIDFAKGFSEWLQLNRWFCYDQSEKKWHYTFEGGTAISNASYEKNYKKTTDQLIELYIQSL